MSHDRTRRRRQGAREFRPSLDGVRLEPRLLLSSGKTQIVKGQIALTHPQPAVAKKLNDPKHVTSHTPFYFIGPSANHGVADVDTARGGASAIVATPDGSRFRVSLSLADNQYDGSLSAETGGTATSVIPSSVTQPIGTVRVYPTPGGSVGIIVDGATQYQQLTIDPLPNVQRKGFAHSFSYGEAGRTEVLNISSIQVNGGALQAILGFHSANLSGPLTIGSTSTVDRIAFNTLLPGAAIGIGGTLNTLDIANSATLSAGVGVKIGRDLNLLNVGGDLTLSNGANFVVGRFLGLTPQPPKGTGTGSNILSLNQSTLGTNSSLLAPSVSGSIQGDLSIGAGSAFSLVSGIGSTFSSAVTSTPSAAPLLINGALKIVKGASILSPNTTVGTTLVSGAGIVARNGVIVNGTTILPPGSATTIPLA